MQWSQVAWFLVAPALSVLTAAVAFRNWHASRKAEDLRYACIMAGLSAGMVLHAA